VDVNVHPAKKEVRYVQSNHVFQAVQQSLRQALVAAFEPAYQLNHAPGFQPLGLHAQIPTPEGSSGDGANRFSEPSLLPQMPPYPNQSQVVQSFHSASSEPLSPCHPTLAEPQQVWNERQHGNTSHEQRALALDLFSPLTESALQERAWRVIGQLFNTYVLVETPQGLLVVDQHIASERWVFEKLMLQLQQHTPETQQLLIPKLVHVNATQAQVFTQYATWLADMGFACELTAAQQLAIHSYPLVYPDRTQIPPELQVQHLLEQLEQTGQAEPDVETLVATLACHTAIRAGDRLSPQQQERLVLDWLQCTLPWSCPHGRPIAHTLPSTEVNAWFDRSSLPAGF
jgi:DNA mismatch repair protein MutL